MVFDVDGPKQREHEPGQRMKYRPIVPDGMILAMARDMQFHAGIKCQQERGTNAESVQKIACFLFIVFLLQSNDLSRKQEIDGTR